MARKYALQALSNNNKKLTVLQFTFYLIFYNKQNLYDLHKNFATNVKIFYYERN